MKQELTITIDVPEGQKAYWDGNKVAFVDDDSDLEGLPKSWEEFCENYYTRGYESYIDDSSIIIATAMGRSRSMHDDKNLLPSKQDAEAHLSLMQLHQLRDCYRQGWKPDWSDDNVKFLISQGNKGACVIKTRYHSSAFLSFQSDRIAELFLANFQDLIRAAGDLI